MQWVDQATPLIFTAFSCERKNTQKRVSSLSHLRFFSLVKPRAAISCCLDLIHYDKNFPSHENRSQLPRLDGIPPILGLRIGLVHILPTYCTDTIISMYICWLWSPEGQRSRLTLLCMTQSLTPCLHINVHQYLFNTLRTT